MKDIQSFNILVSSPSDLREDRKFIQEHVEIEVNRLIGKFTSIRFTVSLWETDSSSGTSTSPQKVIDKTMPEYDIYLGILWLKFGTPTEGCDSGTAYEYEQAQKRKLAGLTHEVMFLFKEDDPQLGTYDAHEYAKVQDFKKRLSNEGVLYFPFSDRFSLASILNIQLADKCRDLAEAVMLRSIKTETLAEIARVRDENYQKFSSIIVDLGLLIDARSNHIKQLGARVDAISELPKSEKVAALEEALDNFSKSMTQTALRTIEEAQKLPPPFTDMIRTFAELLTITQRFPSVKNNTHKWSEMRASIAQTIVILEAVRFPIKHNRTAESEAVDSMSIRSVVSAFRTCNSVLEMIEVSFKRAEEEDPPHAVPRLGS